MVYIVLVCNSSRLSSHLPSTPCVDSSGYGPLHLACLNGHLNMTKFLVENKVDIEAVNEEGKTPLLIASERGHVQLARCLVELKADVKTADGNGMKRPSKLAY
ncbi:hypothetical protein AAMO2058_001251100 [Amorphochlora amoebiformis]